jgi:hypothetical protein
MPCPRYSGSDEVSSQFFETHPRWRGVIFEL